MCKVRGGGLAKFERRLGPAEYHSPLESGILDVGLLYGEFDYKGWQLDQ